VCGWGATGLGEGCEGGGYTPIFNSLQATVVIHTCAKYQTLLGSKVTVETDRQTEAIALTFVLTWTVTMTKH